MAVDPLERLRDLSHIGWCACAALPEDAQPCKVCVAQAKRRRDRRPAQPAVAARHQAQGRKAQAAGVRSEEPLVAAAHMYRTRIADRRMPYADVRKAQPVAEHGRRKRSGQRPDVRIVGKSGPDFTGWAVTPGLVTRPVKVEVKSFDQPRFVLHRGRRGPTIGQDQRDALDRALAAPGALVGLIMRLKACRKVPALRRRSDVCWFWCPWVTFLDLEAAAEAAGRASIAAVALQDAVEAGKAARLDEAFCIHHGREALDWIPAAVALQREER